MKHKLMLMTLGVAMSAQMIGAGTSCIISGDPETVATANSSSIATDGSALVSGTLSASCLAPSFDIRDWTWFATAGIALKSTPFQGMILIVR